MIWCAALFLTGLLIRLIYLHAQDIAIQRNDAQEYVALVRNLAQGLGFTDDGSTPSTYRPPLFAWLLAAWCSFSGSTSLGTMIAFQVFVQSLAAPLTFLLAEKAQRSHRWSVAGGLFMATNPFFISNVDVVLQEPTQLLVATLIAMTLIDWCGRPTRGRALVAGLLLGIGVLAKSPFLLGLVIVLLVGGLGRDYRRQLPLGQIAWACATVLLVVLPWTVRNYRVSGGRFIPVNSQNVTFPIWLVADGKFYVRESLAEPPRPAPTFKQGLAFTYGNQDGIDVLMRRNDQLLEDGVSGPSVSEDLASASRWYLLTHPAYLTKIALRGTILLFSPDAGARLTPFLTARIAAMVLFHLPLALGLIAGTRRALREKNAALAVLALFTIAYLAVHAPGVVGGGRYSVPMLSVLIAITGYGVWGALGRHPRPSP